MKYFDILNRFEATETESHFFSVGIPVFKGFIRALL